MLPRINRLKLPTAWSKNNSDFQLRTDLFKVLVKNTDSNQPLKVGFIISGKVGKANVRNRLRRTLSAFFYSQLDKLALSKEIILIVYPNAAQASNEEISININKILPKISR